MARPPYSRFFPDWSKEQVDFAEQERRELSEGVDGALVASNNLSDVADATTARANLGLTIGTHVQAFSAILQATTASFTTALKTKLDNIDQGLATTDDVEFQDITAVDVTSSGDIEGAEVTSTGVIKTGNYTVATLPSAATVGAGARAFATDATATTFGAVVAGTGSNSVPVYSDGTDWRIG